jgi:hypothetical protein
MAREKLIDMKSHLGLKSTALLLYGCSEMGAGIFKIGKRASRDNG